MELAEAEAAPTHLLQSTRRRGPHDTVAPEHVWIDGELTAWGRWSRRQQGTATCGSAEGQYRAPWRQWHYPSLEELMGAPQECRIWAIECAVIALDELHRGALIMYYARNCSPYITCRRLRIAFEDYGPVLYRARALVLAKLTT